MILYDRADTKHTEIVHEFGLDQEELFTYEKTNFNFGLQLNNAQFWSPYLMVMSEDEFE